MDITYLNEGDLGFPAGLRRYLGDEAPTRIAALGNLSILKEKKTAFFCSSRCPGDLIIKAHDLAKKWRDDGVTVIGGFHSPVEQECLNTLLRGGQPILACPARSIEGMRIKAEYKGPLADGRLLLASAFAKKERRATIELSIKRNQLAAALADEIIVAHAMPAGNTERLLRHAIAWGKPVFTFSSKYNDNLLVMGAGPIEKIGQ